jgi:hypothetical protein
MCEKKNCQAQNTLAYFGATSAMNEIKVLCDESPEAILDTSFVDLTN